MGWEKYIHSDPNIVSGKPVIKGTRLSVEFILGRLANGCTEQTILENYPSLDAESMSAVYAFLLEFAKAGLLFTPISPLKQAS